MSTGITIIGGQEGEEVTETGLRAWTHARRCGRDVIWLTPHGPCRVTGREAFADVVRRWRERRFPRR